MIKVDRPSIEPASDLEKLFEETAIREFAEAEAYYNATPAPTKSYKFEIYKSEKIKEKLEQIFHRKCAYCESKYAATQPMDVEHFRPKGRIKLNDESGYVFPGYWWLAACWDNLLPSCIDCNRRRKHKHLGTGTVSGQQLGKADYFPLPDGQVHAREVGEEKAENPLLINPSDDNPDEHLVFILKKDPEDTINSLVQPKIVDGKECAKGDTSINIYGLNRPGLVSERNERITLLSRQIQRIEKNLDAIEVSSGEAIKEFLWITISEIISEITEDFLMPKNRYSAACKEFFKDWQSRHLYRLRG